MQHYRISTSKKKFLKRPEIISEKIFTLPELTKRIAQLRILDKTIAFTNGVFDLLHAGHIFSLSQAAREADYLIVGINSDESVKRLKGTGRPINPQDSRALLVASVVVVDAVIIFDEDTPINLILAIKPDVLAKGGDYTIEQIVGAREVIANGGRVVINPVVEGFSTTATVEKMKNS